MGLKKLCDVSTGGEINCPIVLAVSVLRGGKHLAPWLTCVLIVVSAQKELADGIAAPLTRHVKGGGPVVIDCPRQEVLVSRQQELRYVSAVVCSAIM